MKKILLSLFICLSLAGAEKVEVSADSFEADEIKRVSNFKGSVHIKKGVDEIKADSLHINFNEQNQPVKYEAIGNVSFKITTDTQRFVGTSTEIIYEPMKKIYTARKNVNITETIKKSTLKGEKITIDRINGKTKISGSENKPVKFIFTVDE